jgi:hypothetical protein
VGSVKFAIDKKTNQVVDALGEVVVGDHTKGKFLHILPRLWLPYKEIDVNHYRKGEPIYLDPFKDHENLSSEIKLSSTGVGQALNSRKMSRKCSTALWFTTSNIQDYRPEHNKSFLLPSANYKQESNQGIKHDWKTNKYRADK